MNKSELINAVAEKAALSKKDSEAAVTAALDAISAALADGENIFYLDINEVVTDETGNLNPDYTWDEVHLLGKYDVIWLEYFSSHGIVKDS